MNARQPLDERTAALVSQLIDGTLSAEEAAELRGLIREDGARLELVADQLLLDSLLQEEIGPESLTALVDLVASPEAAGTVEPARRTGLGGWLVRNRRRVWKSTGWLTGAVAVLLAAFFVGRWDRSGLASASSLVRAAIAAHGESIERVYLVRTEPDQLAVAGIAPPRDVRVTTQGDRFWVEMNRGAKRWTWGRDAAGSLWISLGPRRAMLIEREEMGLPLQYISDVYSLNLESLLENVLRHCRLRYSSRLGPTHVITATPGWRWQARVRRMVIEVDKETKAIRRLEIDRDLPQSGFSRVTFTLVDARTADESLYRVEGHLKEPFEVLTRQGAQDRRREMLANRFGPEAERWIREPGPGDAANGNGGQ